MLEPVEGLARVDLYGVRKASDVLAATIELLSTNPHNDSLGCADAPGMLVSDCLKMSCLCECSGLALI